MRSLIKFYLMKEFYEASYSLCIAFTQKTFSPGIML